MTLIRGILLILLLVAYPAWSCTDVHVALEGPSYHWKYEPGQNNLNLGLGLDCKAFGLRWGGGFYNNTGEELSLFGAAAKTWGNFGVFFGVVTNYREGQSDKPADKLKPIFFGGFLATYRRWEIDHIPANGGVTHVRYRLPWEVLK